MAASSIAQNVCAADQVINADIVVVGAGAGGTIAAVSVLEGCKKTIPLEKNAFTGGNGNFMENSYAVGSSVQKKLASSSPKKSPLTK